MNERTNERTHARLRIRPFRYDVAAIATGYNIEDPAEFASRITALMSGSSGFSAPATATEKVEEPKEEEANTPRFFAGITAEFVGSSKRAEMQ